MQNVNVIFNVTDINGNSPGNWFDFTQSGNSVQEILQCVHCLLNTPIGSVVGNRQIGVNYEFVDKPQPVAMQMILAAIPDAIRKWEPRCTIKNVSFNSNVSDMESLGKIQCNITVSIP